MRLGSLEIKRRVWVGTMCVVLVSALWLVWTRRTRPAAAGGQGASRPFVQVAGAGQAQGALVLRERAEFFDPTPLFFPTDHNYGQGALPEAAKRQPGEVFGSFAAKLYFTDQKLTLYGQEATVAPERLAGVLAQGNEAPFAGFGQQDVRRQSLLSRQRFLEIRSAGGGNMIATQSLEKLALPGSDFEPMEYLVTVGAAGLIGDPFLTAGSGGEEIDGFFREYLAKIARLGERLSPGRYRVTVGP